MKVTSLSDALKLFTGLRNREPVRDRPDSGGGKHRQNPDDNKKEKDDSHASEDELKAAIDSFSKDPSSQALGLHAESESDPKSHGLRIVLKDAQEKSCAK